MVAGNGITKVDKQPVPQVLCRTTTISPYDFVTNSLVVPNHLSELFRIKLYGKTCRADNVAEHHREVSTFGFRKAGAFRRPTAEVWSGHLQTAFDTEFDGATLL